MVKKYLSSGRKLRKKIKKFFFKKMQFQVLKFHYNNKQEVLIPNLALNFNFCKQIKSYEQFQFENLKFKADFRVGNQLKITIVKKDLSSRRKLRKVFSFLFLKKCSSRSKNMKKTKITKMTSIVLYELFKRSHE